MGNISFEWGLTETRQHISLYMGSGCRKIHSFRDITQRTRRKGTKILCMQILKPYFKIARMVISNQFHMAGKQGTRVQLLSRSQVVLVDFGRNGLSYRVSNILCTWGTRSMLENQNMWGNLVPTNRLYLQLIFETQEKNTSNLVLHMITDYFQWISKINIKCKIHLYAV